jgi:hypothetical protein
MMKRHDLRSDMNSTPTGVQPMTNPGSRTHARRGVGIKTLGFIVLVALVAAVYGSIPFYSAPMIGQLMWVSSFAQSFANDGWLSIFAHNFGYPRPASMAFGLPGALVEGVLLQVAPLHATDAYSFMTIAYLALAAWGAIRFAEQLGLRYRAGLLAAAVWLTMPMIWAHAGYSMLSIGIALLPFYLGQSLRVLRTDGARISALVATTAAFAATAILSVFMDGYTFVMFALATAVFLAYDAISNRSKLRRVMLVSLPICTFGFAIAYVLYSSFLGFTATPPEPLDFFRGWGVDVTMLIFPTKGLFWFWDHAGLGLDRNDAFYYGDPSVWTTTFSLLVGLFGCVGLYVARRQKFAYAFFVIAIIGLYFALGPSLKIHSLRPHAAIVAGQFSPLMPAANAIMPTGSGFFSEHVPGFKNMRASYRWMALGLVGLWALFAMLIGELDRRGRAGIALALVALTIVSNLPKHGVTAPASVVNPPVERLKLRAPHHWRESLLNIDETIAASFKQRIPPGSVVAFFPQSNDFLAGYLAAEANVKAYNAGGDKNVEIARSAWPVNIRTLFASFPEHLGPSIEQTLAAHDANYVVLSFVDLLWDAHEWPPTPASVEAAKVRFSAVLQRLQADPKFVVTRDQYFATVSLR